MSNSQLTTTTDRLTQNSLYQADNYRDRREESLRDLARNLSRVSNNLKASLQNDNATASKNDFTSTADLARSLEVNRSFYDTQKLRASSQWYTNPVHRSKSEFPHQQLSAGLPSMALSHTARSVPNIEAAIASEKISNSLVLSSEKLSQHSLRSSRDALDFFPLTLGTDYYLRNSDTDIRMPRSRSSLEGKRRKTPTPVKHKRSSSSSRLRSSTENIEAAKNIEKLYLLTAEAPVTGSAFVLLNTPYQTDLAHLRLERLRLEEDRLLELKRHDELERIRGPKPKWYELKGPEFHYEAHKNMELLRTSESWNDLLNYRENLTQASNAFQRSLDESLVY